MLSLLKHMALILVAIIIWNCDSRIAKINMPASIYATFSDGSGYFKPKDNPPYRDSINFQIPSFYPKGSSHHTKIDSMLLKAPAPIKVHSATSEDRSEEHTSELQSRGHLVCRLLLEKKKVQTSQKAKEHL